MTNPRRTPTEMAADRLEVARRKRAVGEVRLARAEAEVRADNADIGPIARRERALERRAIVKALRHRAAELAHRLAQLDDADAPAHPLLATLPTDETDEVAE